MSVISLEHTQLDRFFLGLVFGSAERIFTVFNPKHASVKTKQKKSKNVSPLDSLSQYIQENGIVSLVDFLDEVSFEIKQMSKEFSREEAIELLNAFPQNFKEIVNEFENTEVDNRNIDEFNLYVKVRNMMQNFEEAYTISTAIKESEFSKKFEDHIISIYNQDKRSKIFSNSVDLTAELRK